MTSYSIFTKTICDGIVPIEHDEFGAWVVYECKAEALQEITDDFIEYQRQFFVGERSFEDAMLVDQFIRKVELLPDGTLRDASGKIWESGAVF